MLPDNTGGPECRFVQPTYAEEQEQDTDLEAELGERNSAEHCTTSQHDEHERDQRDCDSR